MIMSSLVLDVALNLQPKSVSSSQSFPYLGQIRSPILGLPGE
jgi:hypothetical protein